ncbi:MAG: hypothetical protein HRT45_03385 [Bdellovibrionales bacterium]|nr:hypothetical protein [Bdellovibrionales bacterium]
MYVRLISPLKNQQGVSLAEGLVSVGAVAGLAALIATLATQTDTRQYTLKRSCESLAASITEAVAEQGVYADIYGIVPGKDPVTTDPDGGGTYPTELAVGQANDMIGDAPGGPMPIVQNTDLYPGVTELIGTGPTPVINTHRLIKGSMAALNAIYASADVCTNWSTYPNLTTHDGTQVTALGITSELFNLPTDLEIRIQLRVQPANGGAEGCPGAGTPRYIRPGSAADPGAVGVRASENAFDLLSYDSEDGANDGVATPPANSVVGDAYVLRVRVAFDADGDGAREGSCIKTQTFRYPVDSEPPNPPDAFEISAKTPELPTTVADANALAGLGLSCTATPTTANQRITIRLVYNGSFRPGDVPLCRDISQTLNRDRDADGNVATDDWVYGQIPGAGVRTTQFSAGGSPKRMCARAAGGPYGIGIDPSDLPDYTAFPDRVNGEEEPMDWAPGGAALDHWVPCSEMRLCGKSVDFVNMTDNGLPAPPNPTGARPWKFHETIRDYELQVTWREIPADCIVGIEARTVDLAGNMSPVVRLADPTPPGRY